MRSVISVIRRIGVGLRQRISKVFKRASSFVDRNPFRAFFGLLGVLLLLIIVGNILRQPPKAADTKQPDPKHVAVYSIGKAPRMTLNAKVEKSGALKLTSQSAGFVQNITLWEGEAVAKGQQLFWLSTNSQGGTIQSVSRQIAQQSYDFVAQNFDLQKEIISKRRELAEKADAQADELREINEDSLGDTRNLISLNEQVLGTLDTQLTQLQSAGASDSALLQIQQARGGVLSALTSLRSGLRSAEYQVSGDQEPAQISNLSKDVTIKGLELEEKSLQLNKELAQLNLRVAQITESLMYPASPCAGTIERIYVDVGEAVGPGTPLASIRCDKNWTTAIVAVSGEVARNLSRIEASTALVANEELKLTPRYITQEPTEGSLHAVIFDIPEEYAKYISDGGSLLINVPVGTAQSTSAVPFIPLDAVYQTQSESYIYVVTSEESGTSKAHSKTVKLGPVYGSYVEVLSGLEDADQVILDRTVLEGDVVTIQQ